MLTLALDRLLEPGGGGYELSHAARAALNTACAQFKEARKLAHKLANARKGQGQDRAFFAAVNGALDELQPLHSLTLPYTPLHSLTPPYTPLHPLTKQMDQMLSTHVMALHSKRGGGGAGAQHEAAARGGDPAAAAWRAEEGYAEWQQKQPLALRLSSPWQWGRARRRQPHQA